MRIDEALGQSKQLAVKFGAAVLNIEYRPPAYTIAEMSEAAADKENPERIVKMLQDLIVGWDLTRMEKTIHPPEEQGGPEVVTEQEVPVDITNVYDVRHYVPSPIINGIIRAIREDNDVTGE